MATSVPAPTTAQIAAQADAHIDPRIDDQVKLDRLFVPIDFSPLSDRAVGYARRIAGRHGAEIILAYVSPPVSPMAVPEAAWCNEQATQNKECRQLERIGAQLRSEGFRVRTLTLNGLLQQEIPGCSKKECSDLIVLGANINSGIERLLFGSDSEVLLRHAGCPVLVVGPRSRPAPDRPWHPRDILCATDLRPQSAETAVFAWRLAQKYQAAFTLLHVEPRAQKHDGDSRARFEQAIARILPHSESLAGALHTVPSAHGPSATIIAAANQRPSDFIVMGAHPTSHAATRLLRGTASQVIAESSCPVLVLQTP